jgi:hypothetical protein
MSQYGCETLSCSQGRGLRLFEIKALRRIFGLKREVTEEWRKLNDEELHNLYSLPNIVN